jgi:hypothetical protein
MAYTQQTPLDVLILKTIEETKHWHNVDWIAMRKLSDIDYFESRSNFKNDYAMKSWRLGLIKKYNKTKQPL